VVCTQMTRILSHFSTHGSNMCCCFVGEGAAPAFCVERDSSYTWSSPQRIDTCEIERCTREELKNVSQFCYQEKKKWCTMWVFSYLFSAPLYDSFSFETYFVPKPTGSIIFYSFFYSIGSICFCSCILRFVLRKGKIDMVADKRIVKKHLNAKMKYITLCTHSVSSGSNLTSILMFLFNWW
jgi:hypothetical protein